MLTDELERYRQQFDAIEVDARAILTGLTDTQLGWHARPKEWSLADCLDHLIVTGRHSLAGIAEAVADGRARGLLSAGPFRYRLLDRWFVWLMEPPAKLKIPAPRAYRPASDRPGRLLIAEFMRLQKDLCQSLQSANGLDLARIRVRNPVTRWIRFSLGQELAFTAAHERRHLRQMQRIKQLAQFPGTT